MADDVIFTPFSGNEEYEGSVVERIPHSVHKIPGEVTDNSHFANSLGSRFVDDFLPSDISNLKLWLESDSGISTGGSRKFVKQDKATFVASDADPLRGGDKSYTVGGWVYFDSFSDNPELVSKRLGSSSLEYIVRHTGSASRLSFYIGRGTVSGFDVVEADSLGAPVTGKWYFVLSWYDSANKTISIQVNDGTVNTNNSLTITPATSTGDFQIGGNESVSSTTPIDGRAARVFKIDRILTSDERSFLYNNGNGRTRGDLSESSTDLITDLKAYYNLNEGAGTTAIDAHGSNDLSMVAAELVTDGGFENWDDTSTPTNWGKTEDGSSTVNQEITDVQAGSSSLRFDVDGSNSQVYVNQSILTNGNTYNWSVQSKNDGSGTGRIRLGISVNNNLDTLTTSYQQFSGTSTTNGSILSVRALNAASSSLYFDSVSVKAARIESANGPTSLTAVDSSGNDNHGVLVGFSSDQELSAWSTDVPDALGIGYSLTFDGTDDRVDTSGTESTFAFVENTGVFRIEAYIKLADYTLNDLSVITTSNELSSSSKGFWFGYENRGGQGVNALRLIVSNGASNLLVLIVDGAITDNNWHKVEAVGDGTSAELFVDGVSIGSGSFGTFGTGDSALPLSLGDTSGSATGTYAFNGKISDVKFYSTSDTTTLAGHWKLNDGPQISDVANGDPIMFVEDKSDSRHQIKQLTVSKRPEFVTDVLNGEPVLRFDGVDDYMDSAAFVSPLSQPNTIFVVGNINTLGSNMTFVHGLSSGGRNGILVTNTNEYRLFAGTAIDGGSVSTGHVILTAVFDSINSYLMVNGSQVLSGDAGSEDMGGIRIGLNSNLVNDLNGDIAAVYVFNSLLTSKQIHRMHRYIHRRYGISLT